MKYSFFCENLNYYASWNTINEIIREEYARWDTTIFDLPDWKEKYEGRGRMTVLVSKDVCSFGNEMDVDIFEAGKTPIDKEWEGPTIEALLTCLAKSGVIPEGRYQIG